MSPDDAAETILGVDIGGTFMKWVFLSGREVMASGSVPTPRGGPDATVAAIAEIAAQRPVSRLGVAVPGHLTADLLSTTIIPNLPGDWQDYPLAQVIRKATDTPVALINDARAFALAELALGAARWRPNAVFLTLGTGVGGAVALDGAILQGSGDTLGEIGHVTVFPDGLACSCGSNGCLEAYAGSRALASSWSQVKGVPGGPEQLASAAAAGDAAAQEIFDSAGSAIGIALGSVFAFLGYNTAVIGGGVSVAFEFMRPAAMAELRARSKLIGPAELVLAELGPAAGAIGAAMHMAIEDDRPR